MSWHEVLAWVLFVVAWAEAARMYWRSERIQRQCVILAVKLARRDDG